MLGVDVYVHVTFLLLLGFIGVGHGLAGRSMEAAVTGVVFFTGVFICVLMHEFGHVLAARRYGIKIFILPERNTADLEELPPEVRREMKFVPAQTLEEVLRVALPAPVQH